MVCLSHETMGKFIGKNTTHNSVYSRVRISMKGCQSE